MPQPEYTLILDRLRSLANDDSPLLTMRERDEVLGWTRAGRKKQAGRWSPCKDLATAPAPSVVGVG